MTCLGGRGGSMLTPLEERQNPWATQEGFKDQGPDLESSLSAWSPCSHAKPECSHTPRVGHSGKGWLWHEADIPTSYSVVLD